MSNSALDERVATPAPAPAPVTTHRFSFNGSAGEFTRIWWANMLLTICTLGIYSAWAKVRTRKWLYGNAELAGSTFNYHADPKAILKGRVIVVGFYMWLVLLSKFIPAIGGAFLLIILAVLPWIMIRSLRFNAVNTSYRGVRMDFATDYSGAYMLVLLKFLVVILTLGLAWPWWRASWMRFLAQHRYGTAAFTVEVPVGSVYAIYARALGIFVLMIALVAGVMVATGLSTMLSEAVDGFSAVNGKQQAVPDAGNTDEDYRLPAGQVRTDPQVGLDPQVQEVVADAEQADAVAGAEAEDNSGSESERKAAADHAGKMALVFVFFFYGGLFLYFIVVGSYLDARLTNLLWSRLHLDGVTFSSSLRARDLLWLRISNVLICLVTLLIAYPVTQVRNTRYRLSRMTVEGNIDQFTAAQRGQTSALGEEAGDLFNIDVAL